MKSFEDLLRSSAAEHGHLCPGQVVGVRMAMLGCRLIGLDDPRSRDQIKKLIVYVEMDRCAADAVAHVTGAKLGRRSLKFVDYGIMAATFLNLETGIAFRVLSTEEARGLVSRFAPDVEEGPSRQLQAYKRMPESVLFRVQQVKVKMDDSDLPGPTRYKVVCTRCGQVIRDRREFADKGETLCGPCSETSYFSSAKEVDWPGMERAPEPMPAEDGKIRKGQVPQDLCLPSSRL